MNALCLGVGVTVTVTSAAGGFRAIHPEGITLELELASSTWIGFGR
jgi:hypothetical protein